MTSQRLLTSVAFRLHTSGRLHRSCSHLVAHSSQVSSLKCQKMLRPLIKIPSLRSVYSGLSAVEVRRSNQTDHGAGSIVTPNPPMPQSPPPRLSYMHHRGRTPIVDETIGQVLVRAAETWPDRECIVSVHQNIRLTFAQVLRRADRLAAALKKLGLQKGDRLGVWGPNDIEWFISSCAAARAGFVLVAINPAYQSSELIYSLQKVQVKAMISPSTFKSQNYAKMLLGAKQHCPSLEHIIIYSQDHITGTRRFADVEAIPTSIEVSAVAAEHSAVSCHDGCNIQFTSGTTGKPKATLISHRSIVNNCRQAVARSELKEESRVCFNMPFFHAFGLIMGNVAVLHSGCTIFLENRSFDPVQSLEVILREKCDVTYGTPTMWINLMSARERLNCPPIQLYSGTTGGAPAPPELFRRIKETFNFDKMKTIYGLTETTAIVFQSLPGEAVDLTENTVGHLSDHIEAKVVDEHGCTQPIGSPGELWTRGYNTMLHYWGDEENTKKSITEDGWLKTGDRFVLQANGYGHVIGRNKDMLIRGGENIFPREIEDFLMTHPLVVEAHVIGAYDDVYGEEACACLRLREGASLTAEQLRSYCKGKIAHFKIPRYVVIVDEYPKTASGKVKKFELKEQMQRKGVIPMPPS